MTRAEAEALLDRLGAALVARVDGYRSYEVRCVGRPGRSRTVWEAGLYVDGGDPIPRVVAGFALSADEAWEAAVANLLNTESVFRLPPRFRASSPEELELKLAVAEGEAP